MFEKIIWILLWMSIGSIITGGFIVSILYDLKDHKKFVEYMGNMLGGSKTNNQSLKVILVFMWSLFWPIQIVLAYKAKKKVLKDEEQSFTETGAE